MSLVVAVGVARAVLPFLRLLYCIGAAIGGWGAVADVAVADAADAVAAAVAVGSKDCMTKAVDCIGLRSC